ncbi:MAG: response regulator [Flavobacteriales bacterium]|nr:response regulator [Flavobacteriales bacterium]
MGKKSILIVDDDGFNRQIVADILIKTDLFTVMSAPDGKLGCELAERFQPDLVLLDWNMPGLSGEEVVEQLKSNDKTKEIPVIVVTGAENMGEAEKNSELGLAGYMTKPVIENELLTCINTALTI